MCFWQAFVVIVFILSTTVKVAVVAIVPGNCFATFYTHILAVCGKFVRVCVEATVFTSEPVLKWVHSLNRYLTNSDAFASKNCKLQPSIGIPFIFYSYAFAS